MTFRQKRIMAAWSFLSPFLIIQGIFFVYAAVRAVYFSFTDYNMFNEASFVGLQNYANLFREANFLYALRNTVAFSLIVTTVQTILALLLASVLNRKMKGIGFFRAAFYLPSIASSVVITVIFLWLFQRRGFINYITGTVLSYGPSIFTLGFFFCIFQSFAVILERRKGFPIRFFDAPTAVLSFVLALVLTMVGSMTGLIDMGPAVDVDFVWLQTRQTVLGIPVPLIAIMIQNTFTTIPTLMLIFLAGLQDIPVSYYEAASIDGAGPFRQFIAITVPAIRPVLFLVTTMGLIGTLQMFDQVAIFGDAVPQESVITLAYFVYDRMFPGAQLPEVGLASAAAMFLALFTLTAVLIQRIVIKDRGDV